MLKRTMTSGDGAAGGRLLWIGCLIVGLTLLQPAVALAQSPEPGYAGPEKCALCHQPEVRTWQDSPHASALTALENLLDSVCGGDINAPDCTCISCHTTDFDPENHTYAYGGVTCEACHGPYLEGHPGDGVMQLDVDSSVCSACHVETHEQWQSTAHAEAGVQCIGCHRAHSQGLRLTDEALCESCHRDRLQDPGHTTHLGSDVTCIDCHASPLAAAAGDENAQHVVGRGLSPDHDFTVAVEVCANCHGQNFHMPDEASRAGVAAQAQFASPTDCPEEVVARLNTAEESNKSLRSMAALSLGLGMGAGGMLGIVSLLVIGYVSQSRSKP